MKPNRSRFLAATLFGVIIFIAGGLFAGGITGFFAGGLASISTGAAVGALLLPVAGLAFPIISAFRKQATAWSVAGLLKWLRDECLRNPIARDQRGADAEGTDAPGASGWVGRLVSFLLRDALLQLPADVRERWAEEWADHGAHREGCRLVWWAMCLRATAARTGRAYRRARLPLGGG